MCVCVCVCVCVCDFLFLRVFMFIWNAFCIYNNSNQSNTNCKYIQRNGGKRMGSMRYLLHHLDPDIGKIMKRLERLHLKILKKILCGL